MLLASRIRKQEETQTVKDVLEKHLKRTISVSELFTLGSRTPPSSRAALQLISNHTVQGFEHVYWTYNMRRLAILIRQALDNREPVLLVGATG